MHINQDRLQNRIEALAKIGRVGETGVRRLAHSKEDHEAVMLVKQWMQEAGLQARIDHFANLIGRLEGKEPTAPVLMLGSHLDSQPYGGRFDGVIGVIGALEVAQTLQEQGYTPPYPVEIVAFSDEEGCRFNKGLFGSRGIIGEVTEEDLERMDEQGISRREAIKTFGCNPDKMEQSIYPPGQIRAFIEMHIEQGPVLENHNQPLGIVTGISGPVWLTVTLKGFAGHAGSVPMHLRQDALLGAAEIIQALNRIVKQYSPAPTVGTVGHMDIFPNSRNSIAEEVKLTIDLRDIDVERRQQCEQALREAIQDTAEKYKLQYQITEDFRSDPRFCAQWIQDIMENESHKLGLKPPKLMSGPFHDALSLSQVCDIGMIFVRCRNGISHNPREFAVHEDIALGTELLYKTTCAILSKP